MAHWTNLKAVVIGTVIFILSQLLYFGVLMRVNYHESLRMILMASPAIAVFVSTYLAPTRKFIVAFIVIFIGVIIGLLSPFIYEYFSFNVDNIGGPISTFIILFIWYTIIGIPGASIGIFLSERSKKNTTVS